MLSDYPLHPILATRDLSAAKTWYRQRLGWEPTLDEPIVAAYSVGSSGFSIYETPSAGTAKNTVANWSVANLSEAMTQLRANGVTFEDYDFAEYRTVDGVLGDPEQGTTTRGSRIPTATRGASSSSPVPLAASRRCSPRPTLTARRPGTR